MSLATEDDTCTSDMLQELKWETAEDDAIIHHVALYGDDKWGELGHQLSRPAELCALRWYVLFIAALAACTPMAVHKYTSWEREVLIKAATFFKLAGLKPAEMYRVMSLWLPNRTPTAIKQSKPKPSAPSGNSSAAAAYSALVTQMMKFRSGLSDSVLVRLKEHQKMALYILEKFKTSTKLDAAAAAAKSTKGTAKREIPSKLPVIIPPQTYSATAAGSRTAAAAAAAGTTTASAAGGSHLLDLLGQGALTGSSAGGSGAQLTTLGYTNSGAAAAAAAAPNVSMLYSSSLPVLLHPPALQPVRVSVGQLDGAAAAKPPQTYVGMVLDAMNSSTGSGGSGGGGSGGGSGGGGSLYSRSGSIAGPESARPITTCFNGGQVPASAENDLTLWLQAQQQQQQQRQGPYTNDTAAAADPAAATIAAAANRKRSAAAPAAVITGPTDTAAMEPATKKQRVTSEPTAAAADGVPAAAGAGVVAAAAARSSGSFDVADGSDGQQELLRARSKAVRQLQMLQRQQQQQQQQVMMMTPGQVYSQAPAAAAAAAAAYDITCQQARGIASPAAAASVTAAKSAADHVHDIALPCNGMLQAAPVAAAAYGSWFQQASSSKPPAAAAAAADNSDDYDLDTYHLPANDTWEWEAARAPPAAAACGINYHQACSAVPPAAAANTVSTAAAYEDDDLDGDPLPSLDVLFEDDAAANDGPGCWPWKQGLVQLNWQQQQQQQQHSSFPAADHFCQQQQQQQQPQSDDFADVDIHTLCDVLLNDQVIAVLDSDDEVMVQQQQQQQQQQDCSPGDKLVLAGYLHWTDYLNHPDI